ncbi:thiamine biosynthesis protein ThiO [Hahella chejuensis KCTC 2396]|uniref:Thiamine biosynthesis protein ThiO n=1 Tax=Hahella chejuensis (strain KCTC 2396) TaxID=349521 RepID=Q2SQL7_HAHCH|nr:glycine oxidase ThiO [Hahella chejuensis]ABC27057.1 thiamine biosynthesis protein ThiO [Hahella chejuensis KCTC 2396]
MRSRLRIGIAGGGLLGRLCAWRLALRKHEVTLFDAGDFERPGGACWTAAGMISPLSELVSAEPEVYRMGLRSLELWPQWIAELERQTGLSASYRHAGSLVVAHPLDKAELAQFQSDLNAKLPAGETLQWLDRAGVAALEPGLAEHFEQGLYLPSEADVNSRLLLQALLAALRQSEVRLVANTMVECAANRIHWNSGSERFDWVIDVRGLGASRKMTGLRGVRGEVVIIETSEVSLNRPVRLMHPRYKLYAVPRLHGQIIIGATEIESADMSPISLQSTLELSSALYALNPAFAEARVVETSVNCRPALPDNLPRVTREPGLICANGLYRHGYLLGPVVVGQVLDHFLREEKHAA